jgi:hypothetical protein
MPGQYYYGTVPTLAWILNHYFYNRVHYTWLAEGFHPLLTNPKSSNPYLIYGDLYSPWANHDPFDKYVAQMRLSLRGGVIHQETGGAIDAATSVRLRDVCDRVSVELFYPIVYRVDIDQIDPARRSLQGSALFARSHEYLVRDLSEAEFELLFLDNGADPDFQRLVLDEIAGVTVTAPSDALTALEGRLFP